MRPPSPRSAARNVVLASALALSTAELLLAPRSAASQPPARDEMSLAIGETRTLSAVGVREFSEGVKGVVDVAVSSEGTKFVVTGKRQGSTTLLLIRTDGSQLTYQIDVAPQNVAHVEREVRALLEGSPGLSMRRVGARFFIEGGVSSEGELRRIQQVASIYPGQVESLVTVGAGAADRRILVRLDFYFVQFEKSASWGAGVAWPGFVGGDALKSTFTYDFLQGAPSAATASVVNQPMPRLDFAARSGWMKVVKQSSVITGNGAEAAFSSGGEQNFLGNVGLTTSLVKVEFGTNVKVLPRFDAKTSDVEVKLDAEVADLTPPQAGTVPGRSTTKLDTVVTMKLGQALVLSGIKTATERKGTAGLPILSEIPVIGALFGSRQKQSEEVEGAVFIIPSVVDTVPRSARQRIASAMEGYRRYSGDMDEVSTHEKTPPSVK